MVILEIHRIIKITGATHGIVMPRQEYRAG